MSQEYASRVHGANGHDDVAHRGDLSPLVLGNDALDIDQDVAREGLTTIGCCSLQTDRAYRLS